MSYETRTLGWALEQVHPVHPQFFIPAMQRPYVWKEDNLIALFESIYQGFPIGTSLIWRTKYDNPKDLGAGRIFWVAKQYTKDMQPTQAHLDHGDPITLILDGQQRLTSLNIGVRGEWYKNKKKFTLCFDPNYTDKRAFKFIDLDTESITHLITCENILKWEDRDCFDDYVRRYLIVHSKNQGGGPDNRKQNFLNLRRCFWEIDAYCYGIYEAESMQDALDVFLLANDTGKQLERTDLISATLQIAWDEYSAQEVLSALVTQLNREFNGSTPFDRKKLLNIFLMSAPSNINAQYKAKEFSPEVIQELEDYWPVFEKIMVKVVAQLKCWGLTNNGCISSANALIPLVRWVVKTNLDFVTENNLTLGEIEKARRWLISALFSSAFSGNSAKTINAARKIVDASEGSRFPFTDLHVEMDSHHSHDLVSKLGVVRFLDGLNYKKDKHSLRLVLMLIKQNLKGGNAKYELDHIFPKAQYGDQYPEKVHTIANMQLLTKKENNEKSNQAPAMLWNSTTFDEDFRKSNQLPHDKQIENATAIYDAAERLWQQRRDLIAELVCDALGVQKV